MKTNKLFGFITFVAVVILALTLGTCGLLLEEHEHEWGPWGVAPENSPTCSTAGKEERMCTGYITGKGWCQAIETRAIPPDPSLHRFVAVKDTDIIVAPTCTETGTGTSYCSNGCGTSKIVDMPIRHDWSGRITKEPTCISSGTSEGYCLKCGLHGTNTLNPLGHSWVDSHTGHWLTQYKCSRCGIFSASKY